jgi:benzylsuccinate CoA-transferase BbsE subunit
VAGALDGVRVVEFTEEIGSYCGRLLADLGADVVKVEPPGGGPQRNSPPFVLGHEGQPDFSLAFWVHNTSKRSVVLDLNSPEGQSIARALVQDSEVVIEDYPVGYLAERALGYREMHAAKPSLIYTSVTGFGQTGPHAGYAYSDIVGQAMAGIMTLAGEPTDPPNMIYGHQANVSASIQAAQGTVMALLHAEATGQGQLVDVSAQESLSMSQETAMQTWDMQKRNRVRAGERGGLPITLPGNGLYRTSDGYVFLFILAPAGGEFPDLVAWMRESGAQDDLDEEPYRSACAQLSMGLLTQMMSDPTRAAELMPRLPHMNDVVQRFILGMTAKQAYEEGQGRRLLVGIVSTPKDLAENTQLRARDWFITFPGLVDGRDVEFPGAPYRLSRTPAEVRRPPRLGEHTDLVLAQLGFAGGAR